MKNRKLPFGYCMNRGLICINQDEAEIPYQPGSARDRPNRHQCCFYQNRAAPSKADQALQVGGPHSGDLLNVFTGGTKEDRRWSKTTPGLALGFEYYRARQSMTQLMKLASLSPVRSALVCC